MPYLKELEAAKKAAVIAGKAILEIYNSNNFDVQYKKDNSPLTRADKASNEIIVKIMRDNFPDYAILSEEEQDDLTRLDNDFCFVIDPLDGTKEFIKRNGQFTVNIALSYKHKSVMGVIYVPVTEELYFATEGYGSFLEKNGVVTKLNVCKEKKEKSELNFVMSNSHNCAKTEELLKKYKLKNFVRVGSSIKGCMIASGKADAYYRHTPTMEWDTAAMQCIAEQAGAVFMQMDDTPMLYNRKDSLNSKGFYIINDMNNKL
ncbi:MAG: 3'(2'),5'-bisphosphate nucleotidase CysQ [Ruminococcus sp.]|nr:3'(2'),5'-bisphosphate nucleotidase CysQ [Ruminococcus sp.]